MNRRLNLFLSRNQNQKIQKSAQNVLSNPKSENKQPKEDFSLAVVSDRFQLSDQAQFRPLAHSAETKAIEIPLPLFSEKSSTWHKIVYEAASCENCEFNKAVQSSFAGPNLDMRLLFFTETDPRRWSMIPNAKTLAETWLADRHGPLTELPSHRMFNMAGTSLQYGVNTTSERNNALRIMRNTFGGNLYFHGSDTKNWHQILVQGLEPKSGTEMMISGANHGDGVYVAKDSFLSKRFLGDNPNFVAMALVEVIHHPAVYSYMNAVVVPRKALLQVRFLLIYPNMTSVPDINYLDLGFNVNKASKFFA